MKGRIRRPGAGRKRKEQSQPAVVQAVSDLVVNHTAGCPVAGCRWTYLSVGEIHFQLEKQQLSTSEKVIKRLLSAMGLGCRKLFKIKPMKDEIAGRDEQFRQIAHYRHYYLSRGYTVLSMDVKKKEYLGTFYRPGKVWCEQALPCFDHDFTSFSDGLVIPHGSYDVGRNEGYLTLGQSNDTAEFNVACLRQYWQQLGSQHHQAGSPVLLLVDGGGSNGSRNRLFKQELQDWADETQINLRVAHYPPYCSKYNPIEHRFFPCITRAWQGVMLDSWQTMAELVRQRTAQLKCGLKVIVSTLDQTFEKGVSVFDDFLDDCHIVFDQINPHWN